jgi:DNA-binding MarR family transcriptional regulator
MALDDTRLEAWRAVIGAHASLTGSLEEALRDADLPPLSWLNLLWALDQAPDKRLRMNELAEYLSLSRGGLTKLVDRLEGAGLIERASCSADRRGYHAVLLPTGADTLAKMWPVYEAELERHLTAALSDAEAETIRDALVRAAQSACTLDEPPDSPLPGEQPVGSSARG